MKIKAVDILGFKSFFKKTSLSFLPGITALVGPNGCGKSNIVDAIRWALGEQSAKHLRGNLMEDVIFNGSREKKPLGMAEVSLIFANDNGNAPVQYKEFSEIEVTRRVFRNGESEYYINKTSCRLKDITELFLDTGVGAKAYSIIEQGRVDTIINSKPQELRVLIEEAAGISKYKVRKQEALRKMDATRQNLLRVKDVLGEIEKQISSLRYQAQKLKRFKGLKDRIRTLELALTSQQYAALSNKESLKQAELGKLKDRQAFLMAEMNSVDADIVAKKTNLQAEEEKFTFLEKKRLELEYSIREEENNSVRRKEKINDLEIQSEKALKEMDENLSRLQLEEEEITKSEALKSQSQAELQEMEVLLKGEEEKFSQLKKDFAFIRKDLESQREQLFEARYGISRRENSVDHGKQTQNEYKRRLEQNGEEGRDAQEHYEDLRTKHASIIRGLEKSRQDQELLEKEKETYVDRISRLEQEIKEVTEAIATGKENLARFESQRESIQELQKNFEGCSDGVRCIMHKKDELEKGRNGLLGLTADVIETDPRFETAVESVLGEKLQYVIVKSQAEGVEAVEYLKAQSLGRGSFIPLEIEKPFSFADKQESSLFPQATPLITLVKVKDGFDPIIRYLLGDALLVEDLPQALSLWKQTDTHTLVTLSGEIVDPRGVITGGNHNGAGSRFLKRKREVNELEEKMSFLTRELRDLQSKKEEKTGDLEERQTSLKDIEERLIQQKLSFQHTERDLHQNQEEIERVQKKTEFLVLEARKLQGELAEIEEDLEKNLSELDALLSQQALFEETFSVLQTKEKECQEKIDSQETSFNHYKNALMDLKARISSLTSTLEWRQKTRENCIYEIDKGKRLREEAEQQAVLLREEITAATIRMDDMSRLFQAHQETLNQQENKLEEARHDLRLHEERLKVAQQEFNSLHPSIQELDHELAQFSTEVRFLEDKIESKYHVSLKETADQFSAEDYPVEATQTKLEKLEHAQERMMEGINFNAEREYEEQVEKHQFYQSQAEDLSKALDSLQEAIQKINRTSRERFRDTFYKVNENFKEILPLVFMGGKGELILTDESDLLETGVEIMVQPAGKSLRHISLLSGGEKALSAISLLFALYLIKPTPFCLLDEVDSPLDDANVDRFITILRQFAPNSQFIVITHNKKTMEIADTLYGITMEEPGVSKVVSVRLN